MGLVRCQVKIGAAITGIKKLENRAKPAAIDAAELDSPTVECIHPNRNPHTGPSPLRKYAYCPPASGNAAPKSANESAPKSESSPPTIHAAYTTLTDPPTAAISPGFKKIPVPTIVPITMAAAAQGPSARIRSSRSPFCAKIPIKFLLAAQKPNAALQPQQHFSSHATIRSRPYPQQKSQSSQPTHTKSKPAA